MIDRQNAPVPVIGLIGGIGSGKSTVARRLQQRRKVVILDGDDIGHRVLGEPMVQERIRQRFGDAVFDEKGSIVRAALGRRVFGSTPEARQTRKDLEAIVHPRIRQELERGIAQAKGSEDIDAVVLDAAVLLEAGWDDLCDRIVFVDVPDDVRRQRVAENRGWTDEEFTQRERSQLPLAAKRQAAHAVIDNSGIISKASQQLERVLDEVRSESA